MKTNFSEKLREFADEYLIVNAETNPARPYKCALCSRTFIDRRVADYHIELDHFPGMFSYNCQYCGVVFTACKKLLDHMGRIHKKNFY